jgi:membrane associated rhomboid family serine protease
MHPSKKYYYQGYECLAIWQEKTGNWLCMVENVTYPFSFEASEERFIQGNFEHDIKDYIEKCHEKGIAPKKESIISATQRDRHAALASGMRNQQREREKRDKQREREFNRSYWKYLVPVVLTGIPAIGFAMLATVGRTFSFAFFFPYRANVETRRLPILTLAVCLICIFVYIAQSFSDSRFEDDCAVFMKKPEVSDYRELMRQWDVDADEACYDFSYISQLKYPEQYLTDYVADIVKAGDDQQQQSRENENRLDEVNRIILDAYRQQIKDVTPGLTDRLSFKSNQFDVVGTYTAKFAHASWDHILFNLIFFFAFAASVELLAGPIIFLLMFAVIPPLIAVFYSNSFVIAGNMYGGGSLGLSGMCSAFLGCLLVLKPRLEIKTLFWFITIFRSYNVPIWFLAAWYISSDLSALLNEIDDGVGHIAHFVGACAGALTGLACKFMYKKMDDQALVEDGAT